ncbi:MAG: hypothetical protein WDN72_04850 [Alphaproteobacteria bacterium]
MTDISYREQLDALLADGKLRLWLQASAPRTGSNFLGRMLSQSPAIDYVRNFSMDIPYDDDEAYCKQLVDAYASLARQKAEAHAQGPVGILIREHSFFLGEKIWALLKPRVKGIVICARDPVMQSMSEIHSLLSDTQMLGDALRYWGVTKDPSAYLEDYAVKQGFSADGSGSAYEKFVGHVIRSEEYWRADELFRQCCPAAVDPQKTRYARAIEYRLHNTLPFGAESYRRMAEIAKDADPAKSVIVNTMLLQAEPWSIQSACHRAALPYDSRMATGGWARKNARYKLPGAVVKSAAWGDHDSDIDYLAPPSKKACEFSHLPRCQQSLLEQKLSAFHELLNSPLCLTPQTASEFSQFFDKSFTTDKQQVGSRSTVLESNPQTCYMMVSASRTLPGDQRDDLKHRIREAAASRKDEFDKLDALYQSFEPYIARGDTPNDLYKAHGTHRG